MAFQLLPAQRSRVRSLAYYQIVNKLVRYQDAVLQAAARLEFEFNAPAADIADAFFATSNPYSWQDIERRAYAKFRLARIDCHKGLE